MFERFRARWKGGDLKPKKSFDAPNRSESEHAADALESSAAHDSHDDNVSHATRRHAVSQQQHAAQQQQDARMTSALKKLDRRILPVMMAVLCCCHIDRMALAFAATEISAQLHLSTADYGLGAGLFFVGYAACQIPSNYLLSIFGARRWLGSLLIAWGIVAACTAAIRSFGTFLLLRVLLGVAESGAFPGVWLYVSTFYPNHKLSLAWSYVTLGMPVAQIVASPMAALLMSLDGLLGLRGWQWLFIAEGIPSVMLGIAMLCFLPSTPQQATFLTASEQQSLMQHSTAAIQRGSEDSTDQQLRVSFIHGLWESLKNVKLLFIASIEALIQFSAFGIMYWMRMLIDAMVAGEQSTAQQLCGPTSGTGGGTGGSTAGGTGGAAASTSATILSLLLMSAPYTAATMFMLWCGWHSQHVHERKLHMAIIYLCTGPIFALLGFARHVSRVLGMLCLIAGVAGSIGPTGPKASLASEYAGTETRAIGLALFNSLGNIGGFLGPYLIGIVAQTFCTYDATTIMLGCVLLCAGLLSLLLWDDRAQHSVHGRLYVSVHHSDAKAEELELPSITAHSSAPEPL